MWAITQDLVDLLPFLCYNYFKAALCGFIYFTIVSLYKRVDYERPQFLQTCRAHPYSSKPQKY